MTKLIYLVLAGVLASPVILAQTIEFGVTWDPVDDSRVTEYVVGYGPSSGEYTNEVRTAGVIADIPSEGYETYYVAAKACNDTGTLCSEWSDELVYETPIDKPGNLRRAVLDLESSLGRMSHAVAQVVEATKAMQ